MSDRDRRIAAAIEAAVAVLLLLGGLLLLRVTLAGLVLVFFGATGLAHAVALGLGLVSYPTDRHEHERTDGH